MSPNSLISQFLGDVYAISPIATIAFLWIFLINLFFSLIRNFAHIPEDSDDDCSESEAIEETNKTKILYSDLK